MTGMGRGPSFLAFGTATDILQTVNAGHTSSTLNHIFTVPILATVFHQWAIFGFGLGFQRIGMFHTHKTVCITVNTEVCLAQTNAKMLAASIYVDND